MFILVAGHSLRACRDISAFLGKLGYPARSEVTDYENAFWDSLPAMRADLFALAVPYPRFGEKPNLAEIKELAACACADLPVVSIGLGDIPSIDFYAGFRGKEEGTFNCSDLAKEVCRLLPSEWRTR
ncbi:MAG: hypothetical protein M1275_02355 [Patescibacteria group bacterium]|nr:hypothetical protein [Patescibacteria group bacterium]